MEPVSNAIVYIVDDDAGVREALAWLLRSRRLLSESFDSAEAFDAMLKAQAPPCRPCCLLLDVRMPGMSGLALFDLLLARGELAAMPVIFLTGHADVPTAVDAVKRGAFDFYEKPFPTTRSSIASSRRWRSRTLTWNSCASAAACKVACTTSPNASAM